MIINKARLSFKAFTFIQDNGTLFIIQRRNKRSLAHGNAEQIEQTLAQAFCVFGMIETFGVIVVIVPNNSKVRTSLFDVMRTDAGAAEHVNDRAIFRQLQSDFG